ncbi:MAG: hypothetical protein SH819_10530 [Cytophagales bacterium]|nr:hypothetical protein [Cytophagales bacterium]
MKRIQILTYVSLAALIFSCSDTSKYPVPFDTINNANAGILKVISQGSVILTSDIPGSKYQVTFEANDSERGKKFTKVELFVQFKDLTPLNNAMVPQPDASRPEKLLKTYLPSEFTADAITGLPRVTMTHTATEVMTLLGLTLPEFVEGRDQFIFRQAMHLPSGIYSSNNVSTPIAGLGGVYKSPFQNVVGVVVCASDMGGTITFKTVVTAAVVPIAPCQPFVTGTTIFTRVTHGVYAIGDATFGQYACAWGDSPAKGVVWNDFCNQITTTGGDQYGLTYMFSVISNDGTTLKINWSNNYGDVGTSELTRTGGWPLGIVFL